jgi:hypothetical protein
MAQITGFEDIAPYLTQPLVLVGFVLFTFFGAERALLKAGLIPRLTPRAGETVMQRLMCYRFVLVLLAIVLGFSLALYRGERGHNPAQAASTLKQRATASNGGTAINTGRDFTIGVRSPPPPVEYATSRSAGTELAVPSVSQDAKSEGVGIAINAGRDARIHNNE